MKNYEDIDGLKFMLSFMLGFIAAIATLIFVVIA